MPNTRVYQLLYVHVPLGLQCPQTPPCDYCIYRPMNLYHRLQRCCCINCNASYGRTVLKNFKVAGASTTTPPWRERGREGGLGYRVKGPGLSNVGCRESQSQSSSIQHPSTSTAPAQHPAQPVVVGVTLYNPIWAMATKIKP